MLYERSLVQPGLEEFAKQQTAKKRYVAHVFLRIVLFLRMIWNCSLQMLRYTHWIKCPQKNLLHHTWSCKGTYKECRNTQMGGGSKGMRKTQQFSGICPYPKLFEAWVSISSFLACYSLLPPRVTTILFWNNNPPWNRNVCTAVGEQDLKIGETLPKRKDVKLASHSLGDWALLGTV